MRINIYHFLSLAGLIPTSQAANNPLATTDQRDLDILAIQLSKSPAFDLLRDAARTQYILTIEEYGYGSSINVQTKADINLAIDELVFSSVQKAVNNDPAHPKVYWTDAPPRNSTSSSQQWFGISVPGGRYSYDNPDCIYRTIPISYRYDYEIRGRRASGDRAPSDVTFSLISNPNSQETVAFLSGKDMQVEKDGSYVVTVSSKDSNSTNHLKSDLTTVQLFVRNNLGDWSVELPDELNVTIINDGGSNMSDDTGSTLSSALSNEAIIAQAQADLAESTFFYGFGALGVKTLSNPVNNLGAPSQSKSLGTLTSQASSFGSFNLEEDDDAFVVTLSGGKSTYWVLPIYSLGMITVTPWDSIVSYNNKQAKQNNNGTFTFVLSSQDPGVYNWVNTTSRSQGLIMGRWQGLPTNESDPNGIEVFSNVIKIGNLRQFLPKETVYVNGEQRQLQLQDRLEGYHRIHYQ
ncbi:hypothetical protein BGW36DRAFT_421679 [Talaromyces proteolyticus]|uniref:DUF1214 domain-containing protein n=1 Tax=Talaromyces proteolyticus TaxID=1131652 RepID=A0AAD4L4W9_9EURO|nr:uncharacterized protein BGW36DRAFT_421679 [Talaromyces proteolyticus]KAH8705106.1 hypothetical protein BGW36DRAFT_421679 [Talaromyces proteolyticus]